MSRDRLHCVLLCLLATHALMACAGEGAVRQVPEMNRADIHLDLDVPSGQWMLVIGPAVQGPIPSPIRDSFFAAPGEPDTATFDDTRHVIWLVRTLVVELIEPGEN